jgi:hypothetical protein
LLFWPGAAVQNIRAEDYGDAECRRIALLSQEGSVIAFFAMTRGVVPQTKYLRMHSQKVRLWNHPRTISTAVSIVLPS